MDANWWSWVAVIGFIVICCVPMLFMGKRNSRSHNAAKGEDRKPGK